MAGANKYWSYSAGERGRNRVRAYELRDTGRIFVEYYEHGPGRAEPERVRTALGRCGREMAKQKTDELVAALGRAEPIVTSKLSLRWLFDNYEREALSAKTEGTQAHNRRARKLFERCWGPEAVVKELDRRDWGRYIEQRRSGQLGPPGRRGGRPVRNRTLEQDLRYLLAVCNWATTVRENGRPLLEFNPFRGFEVPVETSPNQPLCTDEEFAKLQAAADHIGDSLPLYLLLTHETGHRCNCIARLRWSDVNFERGTLLVREEIDKLRSAHTVPLAADTVSALRSARSKRRELVDGWIFPSPTEKQNHASRHLIRDWWRDLERLSGIDRVHGRGWHSLRRKFATDLDKSGVRLSNIAYLGGWKGTQTLQKCYIKPDSDSMRQAVEERARARRQAST